MLSVSVISLYARRGKCCTAGDGVAIEAEAEGRSGSDVGEAGTGCRRPNMIEGIKRKKEKKKELEKG